MKKALGFVVSLVLMQHGFAQSFNDVLSTYGINLQNNSIDGWGSGVSFYDFNNDGWDDLSFAMDNGFQKIFENVQGNFVAATFQVSNFNNAKHFLWVDYDNDGVLDIFMTTRNGSNILLKNNGSFAFTDVTLSAGLSNAAASNYGAAFGDYDKDGYLDLYVTKYFIGGGNATNLIYVNNLYHNNGDGTFSDVTFSAGVSDSLKQSFQGVWFDYNNDSWPDLYVANDKTFDGTLYENNGNGTFTNVTTQANLVASSSIDIMTATVADYNNDNDLDFFVSNTGIPYLYDNQGDGTFVDVVNQYNLQMYESTWGGLWVDYDNDTKQDLYVATNYLTNAIPDVENYFFRNDLPNGFVQSNTIFNGNHEANSHAVARGDIDNNGFYDIVVHNNAPDKPFLWQNTGNLNNFIKVTLEGTVSNKFAIGSWIRVYAGGEQFNQYTLCGENYLGQNSQHHIFGLGQYTTVDSVKVEFPSGIIDSYYNLNVNQSYYFTESISLTTFNIIGPLDTFLCEGDSLLLSAPAFSSYLWSTGETTQSIYVYDTDNYQLSATDSFGSNYNSNIVHIDLVAKPSIAIYQEDESCFDSQDGFIGLEITNQGQTYQISWNDASLEDTLTQLSAGLYTYYYLDSFSCTYSEEVELLAPFPLNVQSQIELPSEEQLGALSLSINGGTSPYEIFINNELVTDYIEDLDSGIYVLEIIDAQNCLYQDTIVLAYWDTTTVSALRSLGIKALQINPNPFLDFINLEFEMNENESISCYLKDPKGSIIFETKIMTKIGTNQIGIQALESLESGIYYLIIQGQGSSKYQQLLKKE